MNFVPMAFDTAGGFGKHTMEMMREVAQLGAFHNFEIASRWQGGVEAYAGYLLAQFKQDLTAVLFREIGNIIAEQYTRKVIPRHQAPGASVPTLISRPHYAPGAGMHNRPDGFGSVPNLPGAS